MKSDRQWSVRIERQPHRDAVRRLRKAYKRLRQMSQSASSTAEGDEKAANVVQEGQT